MALTKTQYTKLVEATLRAEDSGAAVYAMGGAPSCAIGQLASLHKIPVDKLRAWDDLEVGGVHWVLDEGRANALSDYPITLLRELQETWDRHWPILTDDDERRMHMLFVIEAARSE